MRKLVFCILFIGVLCSCEKSDSEPLVAELNGQWELQNASCFCFFSEDFEFGDHKIEFNSDTLTIENSTETFFITESGMYNFQVQSNKIIIDGTWEFTYQQEEDILVLSFIDNPEIADDEITLTYKRAG